MLPWIKEGDMRFLVWDPRYVINTAYWYLLNNPMLDHVELYHTPERTYLLIGKQEVDVEYSDTPFRLPRWDTLAVYDCMELVRFKENFVYVPEDLSIGKGELALVFREYSGHYPYIRYIDIGEDEDPEALLQELGGELCKSRKRYL